MKKEDILNLENELMKGIKESYQNVQVLTFSLDKGKATLNTPSGRLAYLAFLAIADTIKREGGAELLLSALDAIKDEVVSEKKED